MGAQLPRKALSHYDGITNRLSKLLIYKAVRFRLGAPRYNFALARKESYSFQKQGFMALFIWPNSTQNNTLKHCFLLAFTTKLRRNYDGAEMASFKKVAKGWQAQIAVQGHREARTLGTKAEAVSWAAERETELRKATSSGITAGKTCGDAFDRYLKEVSAGKKGARPEGLRLAAVGREVVDGVAIRDIKLADMTPDILGKWKDARMSGPKAVKGSTVSRDLNLLSHVFTMARRQWRWIAKSPTTDVARPKLVPARDRIPTPDEIERICFALGFDGEMVRNKSQAVAVAYLFAMETAMRAGEICKLQPDWITGSVAHLPAEANKNGFKRDVPLSKEARRLLKLLPGSDGPVFGISAASLDALFRKAKKAACVEGTTFHDSRHAAITRLAAKLNVLELARMVGHRDLKMLQIYYNESAANIAPKLD